MPTRSGVSSSSASDEWESNDNSHSASSFTIRTVQQQDLSELAEVLAGSFHSQDGLMGWMYPLLRLGIHEDLRNRFYSKSPHHVCLVAAVHTAPSREERVASLQENRILLLEKNLLQSTCSSTSYPVGTVEMALRTYSLWQLRSTQYLYLSNLAVRVEYRRQGVAQQLLAACERIALEWGFKDLYLHVLENNYRAQRLYFKAGYRSQQAESSLGSWLLGQPQQLFLHKRLPTPP